MKSCYFFRYVYAGRGWKLLRTLDIILSCEFNADFPFLKDEDGKEFVDLLISLYQVQASIDIYGVSIIVTMSLHF